MKVVILIDENDSTCYNTMIEYLSEREIYTTDVKSRCETTEYRNLFDKITFFSESGSQVMVAKFSGKHDIVKSIGEELPYMIIPMSQKNMESLNITDLEKIFDYTE